MKSTPILFQGAMVLVIQSDREPKTQTRRVIKPQPFRTVRPCGTLHDIEAHTKQDHWADTASKVPGFIKCPYGGPGDEMWVKETFSRDFAHHYPNFPIEYRADDNREYEIEVRKGVRGIYIPESKEFVPFRWTPSIFCKRGDSRITLAIENVRAQRVSELTEQDALAEGIRAFTKDGKLFKYWWCDPSEHGTPKASFTTWEDMPRTAVEAYRRLWNSINAAPSPVMKSGRDGKKIIDHYVSYPWKLCDAGKGKFKKHTDNLFWRGTHRGKPLHVYPNPHVWAITFRRK